MIRTFGLEKRYGRFQALHPLDLHVREGEVFGFLGPNGAGKTTTIRLLAGILPPTTGRVEIDGLDLATHPEEVRRRIGYIPDRPYLYEKLTGWEFLDFVAGIFRIPADRGREEGYRLLTEYGLGDFGDQLIEGYSHGMKQRLVLCAALLHHPRVFIVDEPMVGLDPQGARQIKAVFRSLAQEGHTIFLSTHTLAAAEEMCDRIGIIHHGRLVALGTVAELRIQVERALDRRDSPMSPRGSPQEDADLESIFLRIIEEGEPDSHPEGGTAA